MGLLLELCVVVLSLSLLAVLVYAGAFAVAALCTAWRRRLADPLADELDRFLDDVLHGGAPHRSDPAGRR